MSLKVRSILVLVVGTVLGVVVSLSGHVLKTAVSDSHAGAQSAIPAASVERLAEVIARISSEYVDQVDEQTLVESAIRGILSDLDDHSRYLNSDDYEEIRISSSGSYSGIGLDVSLGDGKVTVISPLEGAPADSAGILPGDVVIAVNDIQVDESNLERAVGSMRGAAGTGVTLDVRRAGVEEALRFDLTRSDIRVNTVRSDYLGDGIAYVRLTGFAETTAPDLDRAATELASHADEALRGLVLDLRNNPGGLLDAAVDVADRFLDSGLIVRGAGRISDSRFEQFAQVGHAFEDVPLVVLVNAGSASASEIVAGAIKDHNRARIVGEQTYGKGSVQTVMPLGEGTAIKLTTSRYITPSGRSINGTGIEPDVLVRNTDPRRQYRGAGSAVLLSEDAQLQRALRVLGFDAIALSRAD